MDNVENYLLMLQQYICEGLETFERRATFRVDSWTRDIGGGKTCVLEGGEVFAKAGVNFSHVYGDVLPASASAKRPELANRRFEAMGVSVVAHPVNPYVPSAHCNVRLIMATADNAGPLWWFGGGFDLTPYYGFVEDCVHWHQTARKACMPFGLDKYPRYKAWCDDYFYLKHRQEARGIGGIFFDDLNENSFEACFAFMQSIGNHFLPAYLPIVEKRYGLPFGEREQQFQFYRRGRYVEFNLIYDRGTLFGLQSRGRTESILISLPPQVTWFYDWPLVAGSEEEKLTTYFLIPRDWCAL